MLLLRYSKFVSNIIIIFHNYSNPIGKFDFFLILFSIDCFFLSNSHRGSEYVEENSLSLRDILPVKVKHYDKNRAPKFQGQPTVVYFHVTVLSLDSINEESMVRLPFIVHSKIYSLKCLRVLRFWLFPIHSISSWSFWFYRSKWMALITYNI